MIANVCVHQDTWGREVVGCWLYAKKTFTHLNSASHLRFPDIRDIFLQQNPPVFQGAAKIPSHNQRDHRLYNALKQGAKSPESKISTSKIPPTEVQQHSLAFYQHIWRLDCCSSIYFKVVLFSMASMMSFFSSYFRISVLMLDLD